LFLPVDDWQDGESYNEFDIKKLGDIAYEALQTHIADSGVNDPPNDAFWVRVNFVPTVDPSPLTRQKAQYWINHFGGWVDAQTNNGKCAYIDHNVVIKNDKHRRTEVDGVYDNPANINELMLKLIDATRYPIDGLKILVDGTGTGAFAGNDPNGIPFDNTIAIFNDPEGLGVTGVWFVLEHWGLPKDDDEVYDFEKGDSWTYKPCTGNLESDGTCITGRQIGWAKGAYLLIDLLVAQFGKFVPDGQFDCVHPLRFDVSAGHVDVGNEQISNDEDDLFGDSAVFASFEPSDNDSKKIAGLNFAFPWPRNENPIPYGAVTIGEQISLSFVDFLNKHKTHLGDREWFGEGVENYMDMQDFAFFERIEEFLLAGHKKLTGNYKMQIWLVDKNDNKIRTSVN